LRRRSRQPVEGGAFYRGANYRVDIGPPFKRCGGGADCGAQGGWWTVKTNAGQGSFYRSQHELIGVFRVGALPHLNTVELGRHGRNRSNVWHYAGANTFRAGRMEDLHAHPTVKPIALIADAIRDCTLRNQIVLDTFCGSGATLLAAERIGRRGCCLEIDPGYVDVAVRRWQMFTGSDAVHAISDLTFEEVSLQRAAKLTVQRKTGR
jgi:hypothetical protein